MTKPSYKFKMLGRGKYKTLMARWRSGNPHSRLRTMGLNIPYEVWSTELWALLAGELNKQAERQGQRRRK